MIRVKPLFWYTGGKAKLLTIYYPFFQGLHPEHCIDYFGGSGTMSLWFHQLYPQAKVYLNEIDPALYQLFMRIKTQYDEFCRRASFLEAQHYSIECATPAERKEFYRDIRKQYNLFVDFPVNPCTIPDDQWTPLVGYDTSDVVQALLSDAAVMEILGLQSWDELEIIVHDPERNDIDRDIYYFFLRRFSYSGMNRKRKKNGHYTGNMGERPTQKLVMPERLEAFKAMLDHAELFNTDYRQLDIQRPKSLHYFDPPYVDSIQNLFTSRFGWDETEALCEYGQRLAEHHTVFMSNYEHPRLKKLLKGFDWCTFPAVGGMQRNKRKEPVREILFYKIHPSIRG
jgi:site-specific DNA-adenine methylase